MRNFLGFFVLLLWSSLALAQNNQENSVKILHAKKLTDGRDENHQKLIGNVGLQNKELKLFCDSAEINQLNNDFWAWGNIYIVKNQEIKAYGDSLLYRGVSGDGKLFGDKAKVVKDDLTVLSKILYFKDAQKIMYYNSGGSITTDSTKVISKVGIFHTDTEIMDLRDSVVIEHPDYTVWSDTVFVNTKNDQSRFLGPTKIHTKNEQVYCEKGFHDNGRKIFHFLQNAWVASEENTLFGDSIYVDQMNELSWAFQNVELRDTVNKINIYGHQAFFNQKDSSSFVTDSTVFAQLMDGDTLWMTCDTLKAINKENDKNFFAYYGVKMFKKDMQGVCDSLAYTMSDSTMRMYYDPILWNDESQMIGDTIRILTSNNKIKKLFIDHKASIISEVEEELEFYDQVMGRNMEADFKNGKIDVMDVLGNGQTLYYATEDDSTYTGVNSAICSNLRIKFVDGKIGKIIFLQQPEASFYPLDQIPAEEKKLPKFIWKIALKPKSKKDILRTRTLK